MTLNAILSIQLKLTPAKCTRDEELHRMLIVSGSRVNPVPHTDIDWKHNDCFIQINTENGINLKKRLKTPRLREFIFILLVLRI